MIHIPTWLFILGGFGLVSLGFIIAALCCAARITDEENERLMAQIPKDNPGGKGEN